MTIEIANIEHQKLWIYLEFMNCLGYNKTNFSEWTGAQDFGKRVPYLIDSASSLHSVSCFEKKAV